LEVWLYNQDSFDSAAPDVQQQRLFYVMLCGCVLACVVGTQFSVVGFGSSGFACLRRKLRRSTSAQFRQGNQGLSPTIHIIQKTTRPIAVTRLMVILQIETVPGFAKHQPK
jgi:hypothetical protein